MSEAFLAIPTGICKADTEIRDRRYCRRRAGVCSRPDPAGAGPAGARRYLEERLRCPAGNLEAAAARSSCAGVGSGWFFFLQHSTPSGPDAAL